MKEDQHAKQMEKLSAERDKHESEMLTQREKHEAEMQAALKEWSSALSAAQAEHAEAMKSAEAREEELKAALEKQQEEHEASEQETVQGMLAEHEAALVKAQEEAEAALAALLAEQEAANTAALKTANAEHAEALKKAHSDAAHLFEKAAEAREAMKAKLEEAHRDVQQAEGQRVALRELKHAMTRLTKGEAGVRCAIWRTKMKEDQHAKQMEKLSAERDETERQLRLQYKGEKAAAEATAILLLQEGERTAAAQKAELEAVLSETKAALAKAESGKVAAEKDKEEAEKISFVKVAEAERAVAECEGAIAQAKAIAETAEAGRVAAEADAASEKAKAEKATAEAKAIVERIEVAEAKAVSEAVAVAVKAETAKAIAEKDIVVVKAAEEKAEAERAATEAKAAAQNAVAEAVAVAKAEAEVAKTSLRQKLVDVQGALEAAGDNHTRALALLNGHLAKVAVRQISLIVQNFKTGEHNVLQATVLRWRIRVRSSVIVAQAAVVQAHRSCRNRHGLSCIGRVIGDVQRGFFLDIVGTWHRKVERSRGVEHNLLRRRAAHQEQQARGMVQWRLLLERAATIASRQVIAVWSAGARLETALGAALAEKRQAEGKLQVVKLRRWVELSIMVGRLQVGVCVRQWQMQGAVERVSERGRVYKQKMRDECELRAKMSQKSAAMVLSYAGIRMECEDLRAKLPLLENLRSRHGVLLTSRALERGGVRRLALSASVRVWQARSRAASYDEQADQVQRQLRKKMGLKMLAGSDLVPLALERGGVRRLALSASVRMWQSRSQVVIHSLQRRVGELQDANATLEAKQRALDPMGVL